MRPATYDLDLYRGDTYAWQFRLWTDNSHTVAVDLTGVVAKAEIRAKSGASPAAAMTCVVTLPNKIGVRLTVAAWTSITYDLGGWDLELTYPAPGNEVITIVAGVVRISPDITNSTGLVGRRIQTESALPVIGGVR